MKRMLSCGRWLGCRLLMPCLAAAAAIACANARADGTDLYVQDGLVALWDAIDNAGVGTHDAEASQWVNLVANSAFGDFPADNLAFGENCVEVTSNTISTAASSDAVNLQTETLEVVAYRNAVAASWGIFSASRISFNGTSQPWTCIPCFVSSDGKWQAVNYLGNKRISQLSDVNPAATWSFYYKASTYQNPSTLLDNGSLMTYRDGAALVKNSTIFSYYDWSTTASPYLPSLKNGAFVHCARIYNRKLTSDEVAWNYAVDRYRFFGDSSKIAPLLLTVLPIDDSDFFANGTAHEPAVVVSNRLTRTVLDPATDYDVTYSNNVAGGTGYALVSGKGSYAGLSATGRFTITPVYYVSASADPTGTGSGWSDTMTYTNALKAAAASTVACEVWIANADTIALTANPARAFAKPVAIRGGFAGTESTPAQRAAGARSVIDGQDLACCLSFSCSAPVTVDGLVMMRSPSQGLYGATCSADVLITNCAIRACAYSSWWGGSYNAPISTTGGGGVTFVGTSAATLRMSDCDISGMSSASGNDAGSGGGAYFKAFKRVYLDDCSVMTNVSRCWRSSQAYGLQFSNQPFEMTRCRVLGNKATSASGIVVQMSGACSNSVMRNCVFAGNVNSAGSTGLVNVNMKNAVDTLLVENCTFAYNFVYGTSAICASCGTVSVRNGIFHANMRSSSSARGAELHAATSGRITVAYGLFGGTDGTYATSAGDGVLTFDGNQVVADPKFVTTTDDFKTLAQASDIPVGSWTLPADSVLCAFDTHLLSAEGYFDATGCLHVAAGLLSPAIDAADPDDDYTLETSPNGARRNLGAYGGTRFASRTPSAHAEIAGAITARWPSGYTQPEIAFTLGGEGVYAASAVIRISTDGGSSWCFVSDTLTGLTNGQAVALLVPTYFQPGAALTVSVALTAAGATTTATTEEPIAVQGVLPPWYGKGGGANVVHVRPGATGKGDGTSWTDAVESFHVGLGMLSGSRNELWFAGTNQLTAAAATFTPAAAVTLRGGFRGWENAASERPQGLRSRIDGQDAYSCLIVNNAKALCVDGIDFVRGGVRGFRKESSAGDIVISNCGFYACGKIATIGNYNSEINGSGGIGLSLVSSGAATATIVDCALEGNHFSGSGHDGGYGSALLAHAFKRVTLEGCTIVTNYHGHWRGGGVEGCYFYNSPAEITRCAFRANDASLGGAAVVRFYGACSNSVIRNCVFAGNGNGGSTAMVYASMATAADTLDVENCTFAYNFLSGNNALYMNCGALSVRNAIFYANLVEPGSARGADIHLGASGSASVNYTLFAEESTDCIAGAEGSVLDVGSCVYSDPLLVTSDNAFRTGASAGSGPKASYATPAASVRCAYDVHPLSAAGYFDATGGVHVAEGIISPAIDAGDPNDSYRDETAPNGERINLGAYGGTVFASRTPVSRVELDGTVAVVFESEYTQPTVRFTMGGEGTYSATATVRISTDGGESWTYVSDPILSLTNGQFVAWRMPSYLPEGGTVVARVEVAAAKSADVGTSVETDVEGTLPPWHGKGGGANVVHVRAGATGKGDGTSWTDAVETFHAGLALLSDTRSELWFAGTNQLTKVPSTFSPSYAVTLRGGFRGWENAVSERPQGLRSRIDGQDAYSCLIVNNAKTLCVDGIDFVRGGVRGLRKESSAGDIVISNCGFYACGKIATIGNYQSESNGSGGIGLSLVSSGAATATIVDCALEGNHFSGSGHDGGYGSALLAHAFKRVTLEGCTIVTNYHGHWRGGGVEGCYFYNSPAEITRCAFRANDASLGGAAVVRFYGACSNSVIRNCVFAGNGNGGSTAMVYASMATAADTLDVENCTFAYNFLSGNNALYMNCGALSVRNAIFYGNLAASGSARGADIHLASGTARVGYSFFADETTNCVVATGGMLAVTNSVYGDPLFATKDATFRAGAKAGTGPKTSYTTPSAAIRLGYNVHLRSRVGYRDDETGALVRFHDKTSPALDAGDPADDFSREPDTFDGSNGGRVNLGAYGNTPWATQSAIRGSFFRMR